MKERSCVVEARKLMQCCLNDDKTSISIDEIDCIWAIEFFGDWHVAVCIPKLGWSKYLVLYSSKTKAFTIKPYFGG